MDCRTVQHNSMPYIKGTMDESELEAFLEHIEKCETCREELEVYYTVYYAIQRLDQDDSDSYDIKEMLKRDLELGRNHVMKTEAYGFVRKFFATVGFVISVVVIMTAAQAVNRGGIDNTTLYNLVKSESEAGSENIMNGNIVSHENTEPETNHKREVVISTPETEPFIQPGPIPENMTFISG